MSSSYLGAAPPTVTNHPTRRRRKPQVSCSLCRRRKLKCDRGQPCVQCTRRGLSLSCAYVVNKEPEKVDRSLLLRPPPPASIQDRLAQLENLVMRVGISSNIHASNTISEDVCQLSSGLGRISIENSEINYVEDAHWTAVLDEIGELKDYFENDSASSTQESDVPEPGGPELLFGGFKKVSMEELLASVPPRVVVDRLIAKSFNSMDIAPMVIHTPTFLQEYERFWERPLDTPVMWLALLFALICTGTLYEQFVPSESSRPHYQGSSPNPKVLIQEYREKTVQCLVLGNYTRSIPYTIETLLIYLQIEYTRSNDTQMSCWILLGILSRIALRMGYHREPSNFPRLSPFQAEMRRRIWVIVLHIDTSASAQIGLPRMLKEISCDTEEPRNLLAEDINASITELPPARPVTFPTLASYFTFKGRVVTIFGMICDMTTSFTPMPYGEFLDLDKKLEDVYKSIPKWLQVKPMSLSMLDDSQTIVRQFFIAVLYHKSKCVLHRRFLSALNNSESGEHNRYVFSRKVCVKNSLKLLEMHSILHEETRMGAKLYTDRWKVSAVMNADFLLATTILCVFLDQKEVTSSETSAEDTGIKQKVVDALKKAYAIWTEESCTSREAKKAAEALRIVLGKVDKLETRSSTSSGPQDTSEDDFISIASPSASRNHAVADSTAMNEWPVEFPDMTVDDFFDFGSWDSCYQTQDLGGLAGSDIAKRFPREFLF